MRAIDNETEFGRYLLRTLHNVLQHPADTTADSFTYSNYCSSMHVDVSTSYGWCLLKIAQFLFLNTAHLISTKLKLWHMQQRVESIMITSKSNAHCDIAQLIYTIVNEDIKMLLPNYHRFFFVCLFVCRETCSGNLSSADGGWWESFQG